ncbi:hypothetical protein KAU43_03670 [candidate division WOR-3 bacterium]|nr:hypothetical protein [candidate division WOR-3 bacterium]
MKTIEIRGIEILESVLQTFPMASNYLSRFVEEHELTVIEPYNPKTERGEYRWGQKGSSMYEMLIIFRPNTIITYGDMGTWAFRQSGINLEWLNKSINSPDYMFQKETEHQKKYDREGTKKIIFDLISEKEEKTEKEQEFLERHDKIEWETPDQAHKFISEELGYDCAYEYLIESWREIGAGFVWGGLITFLKALENAPKPTMNVCCPNCNLPMNLLREDDEQQTNDCEPCDITDTFCKKCRLEISICNCRDDNIDAWMSGNDTGVSSKTLWMAMKCLKIDDHSIVDIPFDADDFGRCYRLMQIATTEQKQRALKNIDIICPAWKPFVRDWNKLVGYYVEGLASGDYKKFNEKISELNEESRRC